MSAPVVQGWCPGAHRPMMSGDGLVVRVRPRLARLSAAQTLGLCDLALRFGNGTIDLTNRANLQLRGVAEDAPLQLPTPSPRRTPHSEAPLSSRDLEPETPPPRRLDRGC